MFNLSQIISIAFTALYEIGGFLLSLWWIYLPLVLLILVRGLWLKHKRQEFIQAMEWVLLEVEPPREIKKTPLAMEQFFAGLHGCQKFINWKEINLEGQVQDWFSLEIVSQGRGIHFFVRTLECYRNLVEAHIYAQYPEAEIRQAADYVQSVPSDIPNKDYDLWGTELVLAKEDAYPIRTYPDFAKNIILPEQIVDPIASLLEVMGKIRDGEQIWIQTLIRPIREYWQKDGEELRDRLMSRKKVKKQSEIMKEAAAWGDAARGVAYEAATGEPSGAKQIEEKPDKPPPLTKAEQGVIEAIEKNISKIGYEVIIRFIYLAPIAVFTKASNVPAVIGCYKLFGTQHLNAFKPSKKVTTKINYKIQLKGPRETYRQKKIFEAYKKRDFVQHSKYINYLKPFFFERLPILNWFFIRSQPFVLNIEELATIYHYPSEVVKAPLVPKVEAKKGEPPTGLPLG